MINSYHNTNNYTVFNNTKNASKVLLILLYKFIWEWSRQNNLVSAPIQPRGDKSRQVQNAWCWGHSQACRGTGNDPGWPSQAFRGAERWGTRAQTKCSPTTVARRSWLVHSILTLSCKYWTHKTINVRFL